MLQSNGLSWICQDKVSLFNCLWCKPHVSVCCYNLCISGLVYSYRL